MALVDCCGPLTVNMFHSDNELNLVFSSVSRADRSLQRCVSTLLISVFIYEDHQLLPAGIQIRTKSFKYLSIYACSTHFCCGKIFMSMLTLQVFNCKCTIVIVKHIKHIHNTEQHSIELLLGKVSLFIKH